MRQAPQIDMQRIERVAIVKLSSIGDVVHALPVSVALKRSFPHLQITWITEERCAEMVTGNPYLHEVLTIPGKAWRHGAWHPRTWQEVHRMVSLLRSRRFQLAIDLQGLLKSAVAAWLTGAPVRIGYHWQREGAWMFNRVVPKEPTSVHVVQEYLDVARYLGAETEPVEFPLFLPPEGEEIPLPPRLRRLSMTGTALAMREGGILKAFFLVGEFPGQYQEWLVYYGGERALRPEDLVEVPGPIPGETIEVLVEVMEPLGSEVFLDTKVGENTLIARAEPKTQAKPHGRLYLKPIMENMHLFDLKDERAIL